MNHRKMIDPWDHIPDNVQSVLLVDTHENGRRITGAAHRDAPGQTWRVTGMETPVCDAELQVRSVCLLVTNRFTEVPA